MIRIPNHPSEEVIDLRYKDANGIIQVVRVIKVDNGKATDLWELISSAFLDCFGNVFYDKNGVPFQGKKQD